MTGFINEIKQSKRWGDFEAWYNARYILSAYNFMNVEFPMQSGVFLEYLREQGIEIVHDFIHNEFAKVSDYVFEIFEHGYLNSNLERIVNPDYQTGLKECILTAFNL